MTPSPVEALLCDLVAAASPSGAEEPAVAVMEQWLRAHAPGASVVLEGRNIAAIWEAPLPGPTLLLSSHLDTVPATASWTRPPWTPTREGGRLYGLGANDAKGCVAALSVAAAAFVARGGLRRGRLVLSTTCEEETGRNGLEAFLPSLPPADLAIVGEPTGLNIAAAQNGLLILECTAHGRAGHAARPHLADNAIVRAARDVLAIEHLSLGRAHPVAGETTKAVTVIQAGSRHNVIPDRCQFTVDLRTTAAWPHAELVSLFEGILESEVRVRSDRFHPVATPPDASVLAAARAARPQATIFSSPTLSDWAHLRGVAAIKWGPGLSEVSHTADEWVEVAMVEEAVHAYGAVFSELLG